MGLQAAALAVALRCARSPYPRGYASLARLAHGHARSLSPIQAGFRIGSKFLIDVNASGSLAHWLSARGHDVVQVEDIDARMADVDILAWAVQEQRIIVTTDNDFEEIIWREGKSHGGLLRLENLPRAGRLALLEYVLRQHNQDLAEGAIVLAHSQRIRIRRPSRG